MAISTIRRQENISASLSREGEQGRESGRDGRANGVCEGTAVERPDEREPSRFPLITNVRLPLIIDAVDLGFTAEEEAFRLEVRDWLDHNLPAEWRHRGVGGFREEEDTDLQRQWQRRLHEAGWRPRGDPRDAGHLPGGDGEGRRAHHPGTPWGEPPRADSARARVAVAEGYLRREDPLRRPQLLPGLQRA